MAKKNKYTPEFATRFIELSSQGHGVAWIAKEFGVKRDALYKWAKDARKPEFAEAFERGQELEEAWYEEQLRKGSVGEHKIDARALIYAMKCKFGKRSPHWLEDTKTNKIEITNRYEGLSDQQLTQLLEQHLDRKLNRLTLDAKYEKDITEEAELIENDKLQ